MKNKLMNQKIQKLALESIFGENGKMPIDTVDSIIKIINSSKDPELSLEIILGIYEEPCIPETSPDTMRESSRKFFKFDPFAESYSRVIYTCLEHEISVVWIKKDDLCWTDDSIKPTIVSERYYSSDAAKDAGLEDSEFYDEYKRIVKKRGKAGVVEKTKSTSLIQWNEPVDIWSGISKVNLLKEAIEI